MSEEKISQNKFSDHRTEQIIHAWYNFVFNLQEQLCHLKQHETDVIGNFKISSGRFNGHRLVSRRSRQGFYFLPYGIR